MNNKEYDNIEIPEDIELFMKKGLNQAVIDKKKRINKMKKLVISASIMGVIFTGFAQYGIADRIPFINDVFKEIKNYKNSGTIAVSFNEYIDKYGKPINQTVSSNGITVTAEKVVCDGSNMYVSYIIKKDSKFEVDKFASVLTTNERNSVDFKGNLWSRGSLEGTFVDEYTFVGVQIFFLDYLNGEVPDEFVMKTSFDYIEPVKSDEWNFEFPVKVNRDENKIIEVGDSEGLYTIHRIYENIFSLDVEYSIPKDEEKDESGITTFYSMLVYDDKGNLLEARQDDYLYDEDSNTERRLARLEHIDKDCEYVEIVYSKREYTDDKKNPGSYKEYGNNEANDVKIKVYLK